MKILITEKMCEITGGSEAEILTGLSMLVKALKMADIDERKIEHAYKLAFMNRKEIKDDTKNRLEKLFKKLGLEE